MYAVIRSGVLNGVTVTGAGDTPAAVVAITGRVKNVNVMQSALAGEHVSKESLIRLPGLSYVDYLRARSFSAV